ncbi:unnamed protein product, partial [Symbiodinium necroappetens]
EYNNLKKFGDSLLSKAAKLSDMLSELEMFLAEGQSASKDEPGKASEQKCIQGLENAISCLNQEHEKIEAEKVAAADLGERGCSDDIGKPLLVCDIWNELGRNICICRTHDPELNLLSPT